MRGGDECDWGVECWVWESGHRSDAGDFSAFAVNTFELFGKFVERHIENTVAACVAGDPPHIVGAVSGDLHAVSHALFARSDTKPCGGVLQIARWTEAPSRGLGGRWGDDGERLFW